MVANGARRALPGGGACAADSISPEYCIAYSVQPARAKAPERERHALAHTGGALSRLPLKLVRPGEVVALLPRPQPQRVLRRELRRHPARRRRRPRVPVGGDERVPIGFGRIVATEIKVPKLSVNLV